MKISLERKFLEISLTHVPFWMLPFGHQKAERDSYFGGEKKGGNKYDTVDTAESLCTLWEKNLLYLSAWNIAVQPALKNRNRAAILFKKYLLKKEKNKKQREREVLTSLLLLKWEHCKDLHTNPLEYLCCSTSGNYLTRELPQAWRYRKEQGAFEGTEEKGYSSLLPATLNILHV